MPLHSQICCHLLPAVAGTCTPDVACVLACCNVVTTFWIGSVLVAALSGCNLQHVLQRDLGWMNASTGQYNKLFNVSAFIHKHASSVAKAQDTTVKLLFTLTLSENSC